MCNRFHPLYFYLCEDKMADAISSGVASAADLHEPAMNFPEKTKHAWSLQKQQQGCQRDAAWVSLRRFPGSVNNSDISPQPHKQVWTTQVDDGDLTMSKYLHLHSSGPQHTRVLIVSCYVTGEVIPERCPGCKEWEDNRWTASAFFHHSQNVPPPLTSAPVHQRDNDIQLFPTWTWSR